MEDYGNGNLNEMKQSIHCFLPAHQTHDNMQNLKQKPPNVHDKCSQTLPEGTECLFLEYVGRFKAELLTVT